MSTGFESPKIVCASALGMENGQIPDSAIVASTRHDQYRGAERGRLNEKTEGIIYICLERKSQCHDESVINDSHSAWGMTFVSRTSHPPSCL